MLFELAMLKPNTRHILQYVNRQYMFSLELTNLPATNSRASTLVCCGCSSLLSTQHPVKLQAWVADSVKTSAAVANEAENRAAVRRRERMGVGVGVGVE